MRSVQSLCQIAQTRNYLLTAELRSGIIFLINILKIRIIFHQDKKIEKNSNIFGKKRNLFRKKLSI